MKIKNFVSALEGFAPLPLQEGYDNAGLQIGLTDVEAAGALLCLDVTEEIIDEAIELGYNLIVSHHPLIFKGLKSLTGKNYIEKCIIKAIKNDIAIYAAHTNLDNIFYGVNYKIAQKIGLKNIQILDPKDNTLLKFVTYVPEDFADDVRIALFNAGAGTIGNYDYCSFNQIGTGSFRALKGANPYVGDLNNMHYEKEVKIEVMIPFYKKNEILKALFSSHPYEEPAFDIIKLQNVCNSYGSGIIGDLVETKNDILFLKDLKSIFNVECLKYNRHHNEKISKIAICGGSGSFLLSKAIMSGADAFITGEIKYHDYFGCDNILMIDMGHYESEQYTTEILYDIIKQTDSTLPVKISKNNTNPIKYI